jgi:ribosome-associated heat shock protein Hsp15
MRLDKWLWAARFFKARSLATGAVEGGKVKLNGVSVKPARDVKPGDRLHIQIGPVAWEIQVLGLNDQRRPAPEAQLLYAETPENRARREAAQALRKLAPAPVGDHNARPTKRDRRAIDRLRR